MSEESTIEWGYDTGGPISEMEFFDRMASAEGADRMDFQLTRDDPNPENFFSAEGYHQVARQIERYIMARSLARGREAGRAPRKLTVRVGLAWEDENPKWNAWYELDDKAIDAGVRAEALRAVAEGLE